MKLEMKVEYNAGDTGQSGSKTGERGREHPTVHSDSGSNDTWT